MSDLSSLEAANQGPVLFMSKWFTERVCPLSTVRRWSKVGAKSNYTRQWASDLCMKWERKWAASCDFSYWCIKWGCPRLANSVTGQRRGRWRHWESVTSVYWQFFSFKIFAISVYSSVTAVGVCLSIESISDMVYVLDIWNMISYFGCENFSLCTICKDLIVQMKLSIYD